MYSGYECDVNTYPNTVPKLRCLHKDSDGLVLAESAYDIPQATIDPQELDGSTHMGVRNDGNTSIMLERLFDGEIGLFFKIETVD